MKKILIFCILLALSFPGFSQLFLHENLVGYFPFKGNANDISEYGLHGIVKGALLTEDRFGNPDGAYLFDGIDDKILCDTSNRDIKDSITICAWIKPEYQNYPAIVSKYEWPLDKGYTLRLDNMGDASIVGRDGYDVFNSSYSNGISLFDDSWHFIVGQIASDTWRIWVDGEMISETDVNHENPVITNMDTLTIGALSTPNGDGNYRFFEGVIDEVRIYNCILDSIDINVLFYEGMCYDVIYDTIPVYDTIPIYDTITVQQTIFVYDSITVTDTLFIDVIFSAIDADLVSTIKVFPNPTKNFIYIHLEDFVQISDYKIKIFDMGSRVIFENFCNQQDYEINIDTFGDPGIYILQVINNNGEIIHNRKILLE